MFLGSPILKDSGEEKMVGYVIAIVLLIINTALAGCAKTHFDLRAKHLNERKTFIAALKRCATQKRSSSATC
jgi:hypothetical protein